MTFETFVGRCPCCGQPLEAANWAGLNVMALRPTAHEAVILAKLLGAGPAGWVSDADMAKALDRELYRRKSTEQLLRAMVYRLRPRLEEQGIRLKRAPWNREHPSAGYGLRAAAKSQAQLPSAESQP